MTAKQTWGRHYFGPVLLIGALALFLSVAATHGQTRVTGLPPPPPPPTPKPTPTPKAPSDEDFDVIRVSSNLVIVPVSVVDANGQPVRGLQIVDFRVEEQDRLQEIAEIGDPDQVPLDIALLFDVSSSVSQKGFFDFQQKAAASFLKQVLKPVDRAAVFTITNEPFLVQPLAPAEVAAARLVAIPAATSPVATAFYDTVSAAAKYLAENAPGPNRRVIVVISDGDDNFSNLIKDLTIAEVRASERGQLTPAAQRQSLQERHRRSVMAVQQSVQQADATFYSINPGGPSVRLNQISMRAQTGMQSVADATGGSAFVPESDKALENVFARVAAELRGQYLLQYYSNAQTAGAQFRRITVTVPSHPELRVRARQGYYPKTK